MRLYRSARGVNPWDRSHNENDPTVTQYDYGGQPTARKYRITTLAPRDDDVSANCKRDGTAVTNTIEDVAAAAGVSRSTASRALSGHPSVHPETRARVQAVAEKMDYHVDAVARALRAGSSGLIGVVLTNLVNASIQTIATTIQTKGHALGFEALVATTDNDPLRERDIVNRLRSHRVDGVIIMGVGENTAMLNALDASGFPVVAMIRLPRGVTTPAVVYDDRHAAELATDHLLAIGHRDIAFLGGPASTRSGRERYAGYQRSLRAAGLPVRDELVSRGPFEPEFGVHAVAELLGGPVRPSAFVAANHEATAAALQELDGDRSRFPGNSALWRSKTPTCFATGTRASLSSTQTRSRSGNWR